MRTSIIITIINIFVATILLVGGMFVFFQNPSLLDEILNRITVIYTLLGVLIPVIWHGINRLNSLDDLDGLKSEHNKLIQFKVSSIKKSLYFRMVWILLVVFLVFLFSSIRSLSSSIDFVLFFIIPFALSTFWFNTLSYFSLFSSIDLLRQKVSGIKQKEKARRKLIDELIKDRQSQPLQSDPHLEGYRKIFDDQSQGVS